MTKRELRDKLGIAMSEVTALKINVRNLTEAKRTLKAYLEELETVSAEEKKKLEQEVEDLREKLIERTNLLLEVQEKLLWPRVKYEE